MAIEIFDDTGKEPFKEQVDGSLIFDSDFRNARFSMWVDCTHYEITPDKAYLVINGERSKEINADRFEPYPSMARELLEIANEYLTMIRKWENENDDTV